MKTGTTDTNTPSIDTPDLPPSVVFELLANDRRRYLLHYLSGKVGAVPLDEVAEHVALREGIPTRERSERVLTGLYHGHLPKLTDSGLVRYDPECETVELRATADQLAPYLKLALDDERRT